jgi:UDP-4-amino-4,6-dideoxy-N-acetyl-beta-L-altrosamine N-acetyltransferase
MISNLRLMIENDLELVLSWRNNPQISKYMYNKGVINFKEHRKWFLKSVKSLDTKLLVFEIDSQRVGFMQFKIDHAYNKGEWGFYLSPDAPPGVGSIMGNHGIKYAFNELKLDQLCGEALEYNKKSINFHKKLGFSIDTSITKKHFDGDNHYNIIGFKYLIRDWHKAKSKGDLS